MEFASRLRWILVVTIFIIIVALLGWGLWSIASSIFRPETTSVADNGESSHVITSTSEAKFITDGRVVAREDHRYYEITVSSSTVTMKVFKGYGGETIAVKSYLNSAEAYNVFLSALDQMNVDARRTGTTSEDDYADQGVCPNGKRYIVELDNDVRRWATTCSRNDGTAGFSISPVRQLFQNQVPDYRELVRGTGL